MIYMHKVNLNYLKQFITNTFVLLELRNLLKYLIKFNQSKTVLVSCWAPVMLLELYNYCSNWLWVHSEKSAPEYYLLPRSLMALISEIQWLLITVMITVSCMARRKTTHLPFTWGAKRRETRDRDRVSMRVKTKAKSERSCCCHRHSV